MTDDPFAFDDDDRTVLRPRNENPPGGPPRQPPPGGGQPGHYQPGRQTPLLGGINSLEKAASRLLPLLITIKNTTNHPDPEQLRNKLIRELEDFKGSARKVLGDPKKVTQASYIMCTALDEAAMNTPWGHEANWAQHNLLATFHNEVIGGERFFTLLKGLAKNPADNIDLLELMYVCLALGYGGAYRIAQNGQETLTKVRLWLFEIIQSVRHNPDTVLAQHWAGTNMQERKLPRLTPLWVGLAAALALASIVYVTLLFKLGGHAETVAARFLAVKAEPLNVREITPPVAKPADPAPGAPQSKTLTEHLQNEIDTGDLAVFEEYDHGKIRLVGDNLFGSGRATVNQDTIPLLTRISDVLSEYKGSIDVTGHSDNIPIRSAKYPSNLALSLARAKSVTAQLGVSLTDKDRLLAEGKGDTDPIADNANKAGRRENRRVEITVYY